jgi:signal transduction histidine kinase
MRLPSLQSPVARIAAGLALAVLALWLLVQSLVALAVREVTDDYVARFMRGTVELLQHELASLAPPARAQRVRELDERFAYPVALAPLASLPEADRARLGRGELVVSGLNRRVLALLTPPAAGPVGAGVAESGATATAAPVPALEVLVLGPLDPNWNPEHRLRLPRELWLQAGVALGLALAVGLLAAALLRPAWRDLRALRRAADALGAGRFDTPLPEPRSRLFAPWVRGLRAMLERLAAALAAQRELTGAVSHELRTPLARLRFAVDALVDEDDRAARERAVQACERDIEELDTLIDASLTLARLDLGALRAEPQPGDLAALLRREAAALAPLLEGWAVEIDLALPGPVRFDPRLLPYALRNGLRNAARHARGRIVVRAGIDAGGAPGLGADSAGGGAGARRVWVAVDDDGEGVPEALREAVFTPFRRGDGVRERASRGFGLGLAIVRRVAESHGGTARLEASPLGGARLRFEWPGG